ncbi:MAG TPA: hypothetical protein VM658_02870 [bacterium]|nr:hypothetical protein [bacterium]
MIRTLTKLAVFFVAALLLTGPARGAEIILAKHIIPAPAPIDEPAGFKTPDGTFNVRDAAAPFHSERLADAMWLDRDGRDAQGHYLDLNHSIYTAYRLASDAGAPDTVLVVMPGTWAGAMSLDRFARDLLRLADKSGRRGLQVWLIDRRSEQLEDHSGLWWAQENKDGPDIDGVLYRMSEYYRPAFMLGEKGEELKGRNFTALDHDDVRFMAGWGADVALRDWRAAVMEAHRTVGDQVAATDGAEVRAVKSPGRHVFIGGHSLGGGLTALYAAYDFDRRPDHELYGADDVDGLVLLEGGSMKARPAKEESAESYRRSLLDRYKGGKVYFDMDMLGIMYAPPTMMSVGISGFAAYNGRGRETVFPDYSRPAIVKLPHVTNEALLGFAMDDDTSPFFIARVSFGYPTGQLGRGGQLRLKTAHVPADPNDCPIITPWRPGHRPVDPEYVYGWINIGPGAVHPAASSPLRKKCAVDEVESPEVTDFYEFARSLYDGPPEYAEAPELSRGPNDFPEWYFPPRLSSDAGMNGVRIVDKEKNLELFSATGSGRVALPVISFTGDDSMGEFSVPRLDESDFVKGTLECQETEVHLIKGYTHLDITAATRNNQPDLAPEYEGYNAPAVYAFRFIEAVTR